MSEIAISQRRLAAGEYIEFLTRTDLGSQYPKERFDERIGRLVKNAGISLVATDGDKIVGVCFGITDFAYWLFITDLGVDRDYERRGIGKRLLSAALELAGGERDIIMYTLPNENAVQFYEKFGMKRSDEVMELNRVDWTPFVVGGGITWKTTTN